MASKWDVGDRKTHLGWRGGGLFGKAQAAADRQLKIRWDLCAWGWEAGKEHQRQTLSTRVALFLVGVVL